jgi:hypothetical protein
MHPNKRPTVINRRELPVIVRNPGEKRPFWLILLLVAFIAWGFWSGAEPGDAVFGSSKLEVQSVSLRPSNIKNGTAWIVSGRLYNPSKETLSAPDLEVRLRRDDRSVAAEADIEMRAQIMPGQSAIPFTARLVTGQGEQLVAEVTVARKGSR